MKTYFIHPSLTIGTNAQAEGFFNVCYNEMEEHIEVVNVRSTTVMLSIEILADDFVIFFNKNDQNYCSEFTTFLKSAVSTNADFFPISINKEHRIPPILCSKKQSFDIDEALRQRRLTEANITTVAYSLSRIIISRMQPTISKEDMQIFISHRRIDGEDLAASFYNEFIVRAESAFRDLIDIRVGEDAQEVIEENLKKSDVVVFIDTPKSGESDWIGRELKTALSLNIPIVWVKIGNLEDRIPLKVKPADIPHFTFNELVLNGIPSNTELIDDIIHKAFRISRESAKRVFDQLHVLKSITQNSKLTFEKLDAKKMIYKVEIPRTGFQYSQKPLVQIIQCYGRRPKDEESSGMITLLENFGYILHPKYGHHFDTAIILSPIKNSEVNIEEILVTESFDDYINNLEKYLNPQKYVSQNIKGIIISGAFADCEPEYQQYLTDAVHSISKAIFQRQGTVIFGAHPTFQHLIFDMGKIFRPDDFTDAIHLYVSKFFVTNGVLEELEKSAKVKATDIVEENRNQSLSLMRECMISDDRAVALVCMGGKTKAGGHQPGVDEEIELAKSKGLPIFIIGSVGGRSAELSQYYNEDSSTEILNTLSAEDNIELMTSIDYNHLSKKILDNLGF